jgi:hypothetical protein
MDPRTHAAVTWLLHCGEPAIGLMTRRDVLGEQAAEDTGRVLAGAKVTALLSGQQPDEGFGVHPYRKWTGAHWRAGIRDRAGHPPRASRARSPPPVTSLPGWPGPAGPSRASAGSPAPTPPSRETPWPPAAGSAWPPARGSAPWPDP